MYIYIRRQLEVGGYLYENFELQKIHKSIYYIGIYIISSKILVTYNILHFFFNSVEETCSIFQKWQNLI